jgi:integrase
VADQVIVRSPCQVKRAGSFKADERPVVTVAELKEALGTIPEHQQAAILMAAWCQLRRGEILGLQRRDIDPLHGEIKIGRVRPKTPAGRRTLTIPSNALPFILGHLDRHVRPEPNAWMFPGEQDRPITSRTLNRVWERARKAVGRPDLHLHDLRHSGLTWTAEAGATTAELMHRGGHSSPAAALRYQHSTRDRDRALAAALAGLAEGSITSLATHRSNVTGT